MSGMLETTSEFAGALGMAVLGSVVNATYRSEMASTDGPAGQTLAGAVVRSHELGGATGAALLHAARGGIRDRHAPSGRGRHRDPRPRRRPRGHPTAAEPADPGLTGVGDRLPGWTRRRSGLR